jgi:hypothetical protein
MHVRRPSFLPFSILSLAAAMSCGGGSSGSGAGTGTSSGASSGGTGAASGASGSASQSGATGQGATGATTGAAGATSGSAAAGATGSAGAGAGASGQSTTGSSGAAGSGNAASGVGGTGAAASGASGAAASGSSGYPMPFPTGMSGGCGTAPPNGDKSSGYVEHQLTLDVCPGTCNWPCEAGATDCATNPEPANCLSPCFAPGGVASVSSTDGVHTFVKRQYGLELPQNYDPTKAYPIVMEGGGCDDPSPAGGMVVAPTGVEGVGFIKVGLQYVDASNDDAGNPRNASAPAAYGHCFADGASVCAALPQNLPLCVNNPEVPYINAVIADVESKLCVSKDQVFISGYSSGAFESMSMGCALADQIRGFASVFGGLRNHRPACTGPMAALMVVGLADSTNPIGPLVAGTPYPDTGGSLLTGPQVTDTITWTDSNGSAPERDAILARNGCVGTATTMYDPNYPECVKYTGCPADYPVVWCPITGLTHGYEDAMYNGVDYVPGSSANPLLWGFMKNLPPL